VLSFLTLVMTLVVAVLLGRKLVAIANRTALDL
jgi:hypothetical protein